MTAELLREAAALMRERAEAATAGPWEAEQGASGGWWIEAPYTATIADIDIDHSVPADAEHIASWHPAVALEVAGFLDFAAAYADQPEPQSPTVQFACAIARAYLGRPS